MELNGCARKRFSQWSFWELFSGICSILLFGAMLPAHAVIFYSTADPDHNTSAPPAELGGETWDLQGEWREYLGTPISPQHFITAKHIGGVLGNRFYFRGKAYVTVAFQDHPEADLRIWKIQGRFPAHASLYSKSDEVGKNLVVFGRGTQRGEPVLGSGGTDLKGWRWGLHDGRKRWGENMVGSTVSGGALLKVPFEADKGINEAHLSHGDSGGAIFIPDEGEWKLAGINYSVDGPYNTSSSGEGFSAAIFDERGLYRKDGATKWVQIPNGPGAKPGAFYATRISSRLSWIEGVLRSDPPLAAPVLQGAESIAGPYEDVAGADLDEGARTISCPQPEKDRFFRLNNASGMRITGIQVRNGRLIVSY